MKSQNQLMQGWIEKRVKIIEILVSKGMEKQEAGCRVTDYYRYKDTTKTAEEIARELNF